IAGRIGKGVNEPINCDLGVRSVTGANAERRISRRPKIDMKEAGVDLGQGYAATSRAIDSQHHFIPSRRRRVADGFRGRGDEAIGSAHIGCGESKADRIGGTAGEHAGAVKSINVDAGEGSRATKRVDGEEIGVLSWAPARVPHGKLGIIAQVRWIRGINLYGI